MLVLRSPVSQKGEVFAIERGTFRPVTSPAPSQCPFADKAYALLDEPGFLITVSH